MKAGSHISEEHKQQISKKLKGVKKSLSTRIKMGESQRKYRIQHSAGYWLIYCKDNPRISKFSNVKGGYVYEHLLIAEEVLGRPLRKGEVVHHVNGDKSNNEKSNLLICTKSYHVWLHHHMSELYMKKFLGGK